MQRHIQSTKLEPTSVYDQNPRQSSGYKREKREIFVERVSRANRAPSNNLRHSSPGVMLNSRPKGILKSAGKFSKPKVSMKKLSVIKGTNDFKK